MSAAGLVPYVHTMDEPELGQKLRDELRAGPGRVDDDQLEAAASRYAPGQRHAPAEALLPRGQRAPDEVVLVQPVIDVASDGRSAKARSTSSTSRMSASPTLVRQAS